MKKTFMKKTLIKKTVPDPKGTVILIFCLSLCVALGWILLLSQLIGCAPKKTDPAAYRNQLVTLMNQNEAQIAAMNTAMGVADYAKAETVRIAWQQQLEAAIKTAQAIGDYNGDHQLQAATISSLTAYQIIITGPYKSLIGLRNEADTATIREQQSLISGINQGFIEAGNVENRAIEAFQKKYAQ